MPLITMVTSRLNPLAMSTMTALVNSNYGFPFTTGTVLVRATGVTAGPAASPATSTNTAYGRRQDGQRRERANPHARGGPDGADHAEQQHAGHPVHAGAE